MVKDSLVPTTKIRGRPRGFDAGDGQRIAQTAFAREGYDHVSVADLCAALNIKPPSFYAAYGSKRALFDKVLAAYSDRTAAAYEAACAAATTPLDLRQRVLRTAITFYTENDGVGCMVIANLLNSGDRDLHAHLRSIMQERQVIMSRHLARLGLSPEDVQTEMATISVAMMGLSAAARLGMEAATLLHAIERLQS
ncbi:TetR/AcrR family transcriptional regulator [Gymnodinialimonas sp. 2305UL16-5]|uniref:TetR/AcrR family transcriptional regulator n=1 Tax=Gymnodinialimonas mytili TaxID=3126503 RepID=UPI0030A5219F